MFTRRMFAALVVCLMVSVPTAFAGGGGTKKDSTIKVVNNSTNPIYAFVDVPAASIQSAATTSDPIAAFKALGGKQVAAGGNSASFSVKAGSHQVIAVDIVSTGNDARSVTTTKGKTSTIAFGQLD